MFMISGFWTRRSPYLLILLHQNASRNTRKSGNILGKYYFANMGIFENVRRSMYRVCFFLKKWLYICYINLWRWGSGNVKGCLKKPVKKLGYEFHIYQNNMKLTFCVLNSYFRNIPKQLLVSLSAFEGFFPEYVLENRRRPIILPKFKIISKS